MHCLRQLEVQLHSRLIQRQFIQHALRPQFQKSACHIAGDIQKYPAHLVLRC